MTTITKSLSTVFSNALNKSQLYTAIKESIPKCIFVNDVGDDVKIVFNDTLTAGEQTMLDTICSNHTPVVELGNQIVPFIISTKKIKNKSNYSEIGSLLFNADNISSIKCVCKANKDYSIRVINTQNNTILCDATGTKYDDILDLGTISNIPTSSVVLDLQGKITSGTLRIKNCDLYYH